MNKLEAARTIESNDGFCKDIKCDDCCCDRYNCADEGQTLKQALEYIKQHGEEKVSKLNVFDCIEEGKHCKIRVTPDESRKVQEAVFESGGAWRLGETSPTRLDSEFLFLRGRTLTCGSTNEYFEDRDLPEAYLPEETESKTFEDSDIEKVERPKDPAKNANTKTLRAFISQWEKYSDYMGECNGWLKRDVGAVESNLEHYIEKLREVEKERDLLTIAASRDKVKLKDAGEAYTKLYNEHNEMISRGVDQKIADRDALNRERAEYDQLKEELADAREAIGRLELDIAEYVHGSVHKVEALKQTITNMAVKLHGGE